MLAGSMSLMKSQGQSPMKDLRERKGFITDFKIPDIFAQKSKAAKSGKIAKKEDGALEYIPNEYNPPSDHVFRDLEVPFGKKDFVTRYKCPGPYNPNGMSEHDLRPKEVLEKAQTSDKKQKMA